MQGVIGASLWAISLVCIEAILTVTDIFFGMHGGKFANRHCSRVTVQKRKRLGASDNARTFLGGNDKHVTSLESALREPKELSDFHAQSSGKLW